MPVTTAGGGPATMECKLALLWVGDLQYEFIEPVCGAVAPDGDRLVFQHVAMRAPDWADFRARVAQQSLPVVQHGEAAEPQSGEDVAEEIEEEGEPAAAATSPEEIDDGNAPDRTTP